MTEVDEPEGGEDSGYVDDEIINNNYFDGFFLYFGSLLFILIVILTIANVAGRFSGIVPSGWYFWTTPMARYLFVIMTFIGSVAAVRNSEHISIQLVLERLEESHPSSVAILNVLSLGIIITVLLAALIGTYALTVSRWSSPAGAVSGVMTGHVTLGIGIGLVGMLTYYVIELIREGRRLASLTNLTRGESDG